VSTKRGNAKGGRRRRRSKSIFGVGGGEEANREDIEQGRRERIACGVSFSSSLSHAPRTGR
jgi:hypothetical protein